MKCGANKKHKNKYEVFSIFYRGCKQSNLSTFQAANIVLLVEN